MTRSKKQILRDRVLRKEVKREKARLRARRPQKHKVVPEKVHRIHIKLEPETKELLAEYCTKNNIKPYKAVRKLLNTFMEEQEKVKGV